MTDYCQIVTMSYNSPLRCTPLSKNHWLFFIFGTLGVSLFCHRTAQYTMLLPFGRDTVETVLLPFGRDTVHCLYGVIKNQPL